MDFLSSINAARILIAESNAEDMSYMADVLQNAGYNVSKAYNAGDALFALENGRFDLILVDVQMTDRDKRPFVEHLSTFPPFSTIRWIALVDEQDKKTSRYVQQGAAASIPRQFRSEILLNLVERVLQGQAAPHEEQGAEQGETRDPFSRILERRLVEQQTLSTLVRSLSAVLDLDSLLAQVVEAAVSLSNAEEGLLLLPDEEREALYLRAVKGIDSETTRNFRIKTQDSLAGQVFRTGQPVLVGDQGWQKIKTEYLVKSLLYVPLSIKGEIIGVLGVNNKNADRTFSDHDTELLQDLAAHAAIAIENARLYRALEISLEELRRTQSKLVQTARLSAMGELAAAVAHQINNPLTTILGDTELILKDLPPGDPSAEALQAILRAGKRAHEVVRRLLTMARQGSPEEIVEPMDVNESIHNTLALVENHLQQGHISLSVLLESGIPPVTGIRGQLEDVWLNLLLNARDAVANRANPQIGITTTYQSEQDRVEIVVWDNGIGIEEDLLAKVFDPFFTTKPAGEGTGLGLHICRKIVHKCQGSISVQSVYNQGTHFFVYLPVFS